VSDSNSQYKLIELLHDEPNLRLWLGQKPDKSRCLLTIYRLHFENYAELEQAVSVIPTGQQRLVEHRNFLPLIDAGIGSDNQLFTVTEWLNHSRTLRDMPAEHWTLSLYVQLANQAARALQWAHSRGIYHTRLRPSLFLYDFENDMWKIRDFGLHQPAGPLPELRERVPDQYDAPEISRSLLNRTADNMRQCDLYSFVRILTTTLDCIPSHRLRRFSDSVSAYRHALIAFEEGYRQRASALDDFISRVASIHEGVLLAEAEVKHRRPYYDELVGHEQLTASYRERLSELDTNNSGGLLVVSGGRGTGKNFVLRWLRRHAYRAVPRIHVTQAPEPAAAAGEFTQLRHFIRHSFRWLPEHHVDHQGFPLFLSDFVRAYLPSAYVHPDPGVTDPDGSCVNADLTDHTSTCSLSLPPHMWIMNLPGADTKKEDETWNILRMLIPTLDKRRLLIVVATDKCPRLTDDPYPWVKIHELGRWSRDELKHYLEEAMNSQPPAAFVDWLEHETGGFAPAVINHLTLWADNGALQRRGSAWELVRPPDELDAINIDTWIQQQLDLLTQTDPELPRLLERLTLLEQTFTAADVPPSWFPRDAQDLALLTAEYWLYIAFHSKSRPRFSFILPQIRTFLAGKQRQRGNEDLETLVCHLESSPRHSGAELLKIAQYYKEIGHFANAYACLAKACCEFDSTGELRQLRGAAEQAISLPLNPGERQAREYPRSELVRLLLGTLEKLGHFKEAYELISKELHSASEAEAVYLRVCLGTLLCSAGHTEAGLRTMNEVLEFLNRQERTPTQLPFEVQFDARIGIARALSSSQPDNARRQAAFAREIAEKIGDEVYFNLMEMLHGEQAWNAGDFIHARNYFLRGLETVAAHPTERKRMEWSVRFNRHAADCSIHLRERDDALRQCSQVLSLIENEFLYHVKPDVLLTASKLWTDTGETAKAERALTDALAAYVDLNRPMEQAESLYRLADLARRRGDLERASKQLERAERQLGILPNLILRSQILETRARIELEQAAYDKAKKSADMLLAIYHAPSSIAYEAASPATRSLRNLNFKFNALLIKATACGALNETGEVERLLDEARAVSKADIPRRLRDEMDLVLAAKQAELLATQSSRFRELHRAALMFQELRLPWRAAECFAAAAEDGPRDNKIYALSCAETLYHRLLAPERIAAIRRNLRDLGLTALLALPQRESEVLLDLKHKRLIAPVSLPLTSSQLRILSRIIASRQEHRTYLESIELYAALYPDEPSEQVRGAKDKQLTSSAFDKVRQHIRRLNEITAAAFAAVPESQITDSVLLRYDVRRKLWLIGLSNKILANRAIVRLLAFVFFYSRLGNHFGVSHYYRDAFCGAIAVTRKMRRTVCSGNFSP